MSEPQLLNRIKAIERAKGAYAAIKMKQFAQSNSRMKQLSLVDDLRAVLRDNLEFENNHVNRVSCFDPFLHGLTMLLGLSVHQQPLHLLVLHASVADACGLAALFSAAHIVAVPMQGHVLDWQCSAGGPNPRIEVRQAAPSETFNVVVDMLGPLDPQLVAQEVDVASGSFRWSMRHALSMLKDDGWLIAMNSCRGPVRSFFGFLDFAKLLATGEALPEDLSDVLSIHLYNNSAFFRKVPTQHKPVPPEQVGANPPNPWLQTVSDDGGRLLNCTNSLWTSSLGSRKLLHDFNGDACSVIGKQFETLTVIGDSVTRLIYQGLVTALSGDCLQGGRCEGVSATAASWDPSLEVLPIFESPEYEQAISQPPTLNCAGIRSLEHDCSEFFLRPKLRLCNGTLKALFLWLPEGNVGQPPKYFPNDHAHMRFAVSTIRRVSSAHGRHLVCMGGGLHGGPNGLGTYRAREHWERHFRPLLDAIDVNGNVMFAWLSYPARTAGVPIQYQETQSNYLALQYQYKMSKLMKEYFAGERARIPWFTADVYRLTRNVYLGCDNMTPNDGTHFSFCPSMLMAKIILNGACDALGSESCPTGASTQLSVGVNCNQQSSAIFPKSGPLLAEFPPDW